VIVDSRGRRCPLPVIDLAKAIRDVAVGEVITVLADDPAAATDIPAWCRMRGHDYLGAEVVNGDAHYRVRKASR
jgi:tRNA 2-thiouridine synthesizing protein A